MDCLIVYITAPSPDIAKQLARALVEEKLAACVNVLGSPLTSFYVWDAKLCEEQEVAMLVKTSAARFAALVAFVQERHPYSVPCVLGLEVKAGNQDYLRWLAEQL